MAWPLVRPAKPFSRGPSRVRKTPKIMSEFRKMLFCSLLCMNSKTFLHHINLFYKQLGTDGAVHQAFV